MTQQQVYHASYSPDVDTVVRERQDMNHPLTEYDLGADELVQSLQSLLEFLHLKLFYKKTHFSCIWEAQDHTQPSPSVLKLLS